MFRTYDPQQDRLVAVKAFKLDVPPQTVARLADALRRLVDRPATSAGPVRLLDAGLEGTRAFVAMEYLAGESIDVAWRQQLPMPIERALPILSAVAEAIDAGWAQGLGHGSLHPRDLFVSAASDDIRLTGMGIVQAIESIGEKAPARRPYAAPERVAAHPWGLAADIYSLGVIAHELLAGRRPSGAEQDGVFAPSLSPEARVRVRRVLSAALADRPEDRFASAVALVEALGAGARGDAVDLPVPRTGAQELAAAIVAVEAVAASEPVAPPAEPQIVLPLEILEADHAATPVSEPSTKAPEDLVEIAPPVLISTDLPAPSADERPFRSTELVAAGVSPTRIAPRPAHAFEIDRPVATVVPSPYPWAAVAAAAIAGLVLGGVAGYRLGLGRTAPGGASATAITSPARSETDVPVAAESARSANVPPPRVTIDRPTPAAASTGRLVVSSVPSGALVFVDGRRLGDTPTTLRDLPLGPHTVQIAHPGYVPRSESVTLTASHPVRTLAVELRRGLPTDGVRTGSVFFDSRPRGARVLVGGQFVGFTPVGVPELAPGDHSVRFELTGFSPTTSTVTVKPGVQARLAVTLK